MIKAPWTAELVEHLNMYQREGNFHPYTCGGNRSDNAHKEYAIRNGDRDWGLLVASTEGWYCPVCDYKQDWCHGPA